MNDKKSRTNYASPVAHPDIPGAFHCAFGIVGQPPEWVMERGQRKTFASRDEAELSGYRSMVSKMNTASVRHPVISRGSIRTVRDIGSDRKPATGSESERERIFANFDQKKI